MPPPDAILEPTINVGQYGKAAWRQPGGYGRNDTGYYQVFRFEGTVNEIRQMAAFYDSNGATYDVEELTGRRARLSVRIGNNPGGAELSEDVWELDAQETQKDLLEADFPYGSLSALDRYQREVVKNAIDGNIGLTEARAAIQAQYPGITVPAVSAAATSFYLLMRAGVRAFPVEATVIRHTRTVSNTWAVQASFSNVGRILENGSMNSLEGSGTLFLFGLPTIPTAAQLIESTGDLQYGWRKIRPSVRRLTYNKWQIVNVYQFGLWAVKLYGQVI